MNKVIFNHFELECHYHKYRSCVYNAHISLNCYLIVFNYMIFF